MQEAMGIGPSQLQNIFEQNTRCHPILSYCQLYVHFVVNQVLSYATWKGMCEKNEDVIRVYMQVKELVDMRDKYIDVV